jgi:hypothetical protein
MGLLRCAWLTNNDARDSKKTAREDESPMATTLSRHVKKAPTPNRPTKRITLQCSLSPTRTCLMAKSSEFYFWPKAPIRCPTFSNRRGSGKSRLCGPSRRAAFRA